MSQSKSRSGKAAPAANRGAPAKKVSSPKGKKARPDLVSKVPRILFEGDQPPPSPHTPVQKYAMAPVSHNAGPTAEAKLPEAYGTEKLGVIARDPHCLYVFWDVTRDQQQRYFEGSGQRELLLRIHEHPGSDRLVNELRTDPQSRSWFVLVPRGGAEYRATLGFNQPGQGWVSVAVSDIVRTPSGELSAEREVRFAAVIAPPKVTLQKPPAHVPPAAPSPSSYGIGDFGVPIAHWKTDVPEQAEFELGLPPAETWSPAREQVLEKLINLEAIRREWIGSLELAQLIARQHLESEIVSLARQLGPQMWSEQRGGISSPLGGQPSGPRQFWFDLNAELVVYGATEPSARVTLGGREIKLRPDGTFSFRFALPDGSFELPAAATSADKETRAAILRFIRQTEYHAEVGSHPQDPSLNPP
jgi:hypothetical protein